jgi:carbon storage regulator
MLALEIRDNDYIMIGDDIKVRFYQKGDTMRVAVDAPKHLKILRGDIYEHTPKQTKPAKAEQLNKPKREKLPAAEQLSH